VNELSDLANGGVVLPFGDTRPRIAGDAFIAAGSLIIGNVEIAARASVWFNAVVRADVNTITIGENTNLQDGSVVHVTRKAHGTFIGANITIGHMALIHGCTLEDGCFIGMRATVMDGAVVQSGAMIAAGALVTPRKVVPSGELWGGSPAKFMRKLSDDERAYMKNSSAHYAKLAAMYRTGEVTR
jgi:carbonic anhydrase/acetyltransferase-like protein (isoleucine patch superfamily)